MSNLFFAMGIISLFVFNGSVYAASSDDETTVHFSVTTKCNVSYFGYHCNGPIKFDASKLPGWQKDPSKKDFYYYSAPNDTSGLATHEKLRMDFLRKACQPAGFGLTELFDILTCTPKGDEQEIRFRAGLLADIAFICNAAGGAEFIKQVYPKATWTLLARMPHFYITDNPPAGLAESFEKLRVKPPEGCRYKKSLSTFERE